MMYLEINHATGFRRLHTKESMLNRIRAQKLVQFSMPAPSKPLDTHYSRFRVATGSDLRAKQAKPSGAWGLREKVTCVYCKGAGRVSDDGNGSYMCWKCSGVGFHSTPERIEQ